MLVIYVQIFCAYFYLISVLWMLRAYMRFQQCLNYIVDGRMSTVNKWNIKTWWYSIYLISQYGILCIDINYQYLIFNIYFDFVRIETKIVENGCAKCFYLTQLHNLMAILKNVCNFFYMISFAGCFRPGSINYWWWRWCWCSFGS